MFKEKVNEYLKGIGLKNIFRNFLWKKWKSKWLFFFLAIFIFFIKVVLKLS